MGGKTTIEGLRYTDILKYAERNGISYRQASRHPYVLTHPGLIPCALGPTTSVKQHIMLFSPNTYAGQVERDIVNQLRNIPTQSSYAQKRVAQVLLQKVADEIYGNNDGYADLTEIYRAREQISREIKEMVENGTISQNELTNNRALRYLSKGF